MSNNILQIKELSLHDLKLISGGEDEHTLEIEELRPSGTVAVTTTMPVTENIPAVPTFM